MASLELKCFTVAQVRSWLEHDAVVEGLSDAVIAPARAFAIIHNPFVNDDSAIVSALYENGELAAYTACFPERMQNTGRICWWFSTLSCQKKFEGKGYGLIVVGRLCEQNGIENCFDLGGALETVEIFSYLGLNLSRVPLYELSAKSFSENLKGKLAEMKYILSGGHLAARNRRNICKRLSDCDYSVRYLKYIDDTSYAFIQANSGKDVFLRRQEMLNWIVSFPFMNESPLEKRVPADLAFSSTLDVYQIKAVQVLKDGKIIGIYIIRQCTWNLGIKYLYYTPGHKEDVFLSILEHIIYYKNKKFHTQNKELADFVHSSGIFPNRHVYDLSFSYPRTFEYDGTCNVQGGDGDLFV